MAIPTDDNKCEKHPKSPAAGIPAHLYLQPSKEPSQHIHVLRQGLQKQESLQNMRKAPNQC
jgi:hypothetical protein